MKNKKNIRMLVFTLFLVLVLFIPSLNSKNPHLQARGVENTDENYVYHFPIFHYQSQPQPLAATSYYLITVDGAFLYNLGCELGTRDKNIMGAQDSVVVLNFSYPICKDDQGETFIGADLYGFGPVSMNEISSAVKNFALGYYACTGSDNESNLVIGMGTNNRPNSCETGEEAAAHGTAWSTEVNNINHWAVNQGIFHQVQVFGASNIELGWNTPVWSRAWVTAFDQAGNNLFLHFGDAAGCPYETYPNWSCQGDWTQEDVWYVSYGSPAALPLPLIYLTNGVHAKQWAFLSQYSVREHGHRMDFTGVFTQKQACEQRPWYCRDKGIDNTPYEAYLQLSTELNKFPATAQNLRWKTDIRWTVKEEIQQSNLIIDSEQLTDDQHLFDEQFNKLRIELQNPHLSDNLRTSLEKKLDTYSFLAGQINASKQNPAPKDSSIISITPSITDPEFKTGIFEKSDIPFMPYGARINNVWQTTTDDGYIQIAAGTSPDEPDEGALYIVQTSSDKTSSISTKILAPQGSGPLVIIEVAENSLRIQSKNGQNFVYNLRDFSLTPADY